MSTNKKSIKVDIEQFYHESYDFWKIVKKSSESLSPIKVESKSKKLDRRVEADFKH